MAAGLLALVPQDRPESATRLEGRALVGRPAAVRNIAGQCRLFVNLGGGRMLTLRPTMQPFAELRLARWVAAAERIAHISLFV